jgi:hypothetical protein
MNIAMQGDRLIFWGHWQPLKLSAANPKMFAAWYSEIAHCLNAVWDSGKFGMSHDRVIYTYIYYIYIYIYIISGWIYDDLAHCDVTGMMIGMGNPPKWHLYFSYCLVCFFMIPPDHIPNHT